MSTDFVDFTPDDIRAVASGTASRRQLIVVLTSQTCGEPCWHAREEVCRCSCGGRNHGCLNTGGKQPERTSKIDGHLYKLTAVGPFRDLLKEATEINRAAGYKAVAKPTLVWNSRGVPAEEEPQAIAAKARGENVWWMQYKYTWSETDSGAPARLKRPSASQLKWNECAGWLTHSDQYLLWTRVEMPERPRMAVVDRETGEPLDEQAPPKK